MASRLAGSAPRPPQCVNLRLTRNTNDNVGVDRYCIYRQTDAYFDVAGLTPVLITETSSAEFPENVGDLTVNYYFTVTAMDGAENESSASLPVGENDFELYDGL